MGFALSGCKVQGAVDGATAAIMAEVLAEALGDYSKDDLAKMTPEKRQEARKRIADIARLGASIIALITGQNVNIAITTATNAVENNFVAHGAYRQFKGETPFDNDDRAEDGYDTDEDRLEDTDFEQGKA
jgi:acyl-CoA reductase-like NAD-dependent aldehyde dehydrogenase